MFNIFITSDLILYYDQVVLIFEKSKNYTVNSIDDAEINHYVSILNPPYFCFTIKH